MAEQIASSRGFDKGQSFLQLMGWLIIVLMLVGPAPAAPILQDSASTEAAPLHRQSGRGKSRYTRLVGVLDKFDERKLRLQMCM